MIETAAVVWAISKRFGPSKIVSDFVLRNSDLRQSIRLTGFRITRFGVHFTTKE